MTSDDAHFLSAQFSITVCYFLSEPAVWHATPEENGRAIYRFAVSNHFLAALPQTIDRYIIQTDVSPVRQLRVRVIHLIGLINSQYPRFITCTVIMLISHLYNSSGIFAFVFLINVSYYNNRLSPSHKMKFVFVIWLEDMNATGIAEWESHFRRENIKLPALKIPIELLSLASYRVLQNYH